MCLLPTILILGYPRNNATDSSSISCCALITALRRMTGSAPLSPRAINSSKRGLEKPEPLYSTPVPQYCFKNQKIAVSHQLTAILLNLYTLIYFKVSLMHILLCF